MESKLETIQGVELDEQAPEVPYNQFKRHSSGSKAVPTRKVIKICYRKSSSALLSHLSFNSRGTTRARCLRSSPHQPQTMLEEVEGLTKKKDKEKAHATLKRF